MGSRELKAYCAIDEPTLDVLKFAMADLHLTARAYNRILKVARTIADLAGSENIFAGHISEAIQYRSLDRQIWTWIYFNSAKQFTLGRNRNATN